MGAGKTTVGQALAERTGWAHLDNDYRLAAATGQSLGGYAARGRAALHDLEARLAAELLSTAPPFVAGVAASVAERPELVDGIRERAFGVYLRARVATLVARIGSDPARPWLRPDPGVYLTRVLAEREPGYLRAARLVVDVDRWDASATAAAIAEALERAADRAPDEA